MAPTEVRERALQSARMAFDTNCQGIANAPDFSTGCEVACSVPGVGIRLSGREKAGCPLSAATQRS
jgi:hypothetical protein